MPVPEADPVVQWTATQRELDDLDLLVNRAFEPPLAGFVDPSTAGEAASDHPGRVSARLLSLRLATGRLDLIDPEGAPLARLTVTGTWQATEGRRRAGRRCRAARPQRVRCLSGVASLTGAGPCVVPVRHACSRYPSPGPLTTVDLDTISNASAESGRVPLLLVCVGDGMPRTVSAPALIRATIAAAALSEPEAVVVAASVADHGWSGPHGVWRSPNDWLLASVSRLLRRRDPGAGGRRRVATFRRPSSRS